MGMHPRVQRGLTLAQAPHHHRLPPRQPRGLAGSPSAGAEPSGELAGAAVISAAASQTWQSVSAIPGASRLFLMPLKSRQFFT